MNPQELVQALRESSLTPYTTEQVKAGVISPYTLLRVMRAQEGVKTLEELFYKIDDEVVLLEIAAALGLQGHPPIVKAWTTLKEGGNRRVKQFCEQIKGLRDKTSQRIENAAVIAEARICECDRPARAFVLRRQQQAAAQTCVAAEAEEIEKAFRQFDREGDVFYTRFAQVLASVMEQVS